MSFDFEPIKGSLKQIKSKVKSQRPNHLVIIQNGNFYEASGDDAKYFQELFGYKLFVRFGTEKTGFPTYSKKVFSDLEQLNKSYVLVTQIPVAPNGAKRAISKVFNGSDFEIKQNRNTDDSNGNDSNGNDSGSKLSYTIREPKITKKGARIVENKFTKATHVPKYEKDYETRKTDEPLGTREDFKTMRGRQSFINKINKIKK